MVQFIRTMLVHMYVMYCMYTTLYICTFVQYIPANHVKVSMSVHGPMSAHTEQRNTVLKIYPQPLYTVTKLGKLTFISMIFC